MYQPIDQIKTGINIKIMVKSAGYEVKDIQEYLYLSCPQPIYRWFKGKILPSVEHLYALSKLLNVHMEDLLVMQGQSVKGGVGEMAGGKRNERLLSYWKRIQAVA